MVQSCGLPVAGVIVAATNPEIEHLLRLPPSYGLDAAEPAASASYTGLPST